MIRDEKIRLVAARPVSNHFRLVALVSVAVFVASLAFAGEVATSDVGTGGSSASTGAVTEAPEVTHLRTINLASEGGASVATLVFSPDSHYIAALIDSPARRTADIVVWDLLHDKEQARILDLHIYAFPYMSLRWSPDGRYVMLGRGSTSWPMQLWDPMTGGVAKELTVSGGIPSAYNSDGSKLLVNTTPILSVHPVDGTFRIYDTTTWSFQDFDSGGLTIQSLGWTANGTILLAGIWPRWSVGQEIDGVTPAMSDALAREIDPTGSRPSRSVILGHGMPVKGLSGLLSPGFISVRTATADANGDLIALGSGDITVLDTRTLKPTFVYSAAEPDSKYAGMPGGLFGTNVALSPSGEFLFVAGYRGERSIILDARSGEVLSSFPSGERGLSASPDGTMLALGDGPRVQIYTLQVKSNVPR